MQVCKGRWNDIDNSGFWRKVWKLGVPAKVKNFIWRSLNDCLPTLTNLREKRVPVSELCNVCGLVAESISHCLVWCNFARSCWSAMGLGDVGSQVNSFQSWFEEIFTIYPEKLDIVTMVCWGI